MDQVVPRLWVGDLSAALSIESLSQAGITHIVTCLKQRLPVPPTLLDGRKIAPENILQVRIDDLDQAPILAHFASCNEFISQALQEEWVCDDDDEDSGESENKTDGYDVDALVKGQQRRKGKWGHWQTTGQATVLIHCQAGCSRSVTICAAYLMWTRRISANDAVKMIQARRPTADPNPGFFEQLQLYQQVDYEIDMRHQAVRRFLMSKTDILNGDSDKDMLLSYYPSPYPSPAHSSSRRDGQQNSSGSIDEKATENTDRLVRDVTSMPRQERNNNRATFSKPSFQGPKLRCKSCRRELASLDHVIQHDPGMGQLAFGHRKRQTGPQKYFGDKKAASSQSLTSNSLQGIQALGAVPSSTAQDVDDGANQSGTEVLNPRIRTQIDQSLHLSSAQTFPPTNPPTHIEQTDSINQPATTGPVAKPRPVQSAASLSSRLPPHLAALRNGGRIPVVTSGQSRQAPGPTQPTPLSSLKTHTNQGNVEIPIQGTMLHSLDCSTYFIEPMAWMAILADGENSGRLSCPAKHCQAKLGNWDWAGMQCGCGAWVTPAFALHRSKVDEIHSQ